MHRTAVRIAALLAIAPLLLLAASGLALAHWDDQIDVNGSVSLGVFNMQMSDHGGWDNETDYDVGSFSTNLQDNDDGDDVYDGGTGDLFTFTISNAYPGYEACFEFDVTNAGTVPALLQSASISIDTSSLEDPNDDIFIYVALYHDSDDTADMDLTDDVLLAEKEIGDPATTWNFYPAGSTTLLEAFQSSGLDEVAPGDSQIFTLCVGISADPNADETMMDDSFSVSITLDYVQAVP